jgi:glucokinase
MEGNSDRIALGIDLGGTKTITSVINSRGEILSHDRDFTNREGAEMVIRSIRKLVSRSLEQAGISMSELDAIGVGVSGLSSPETGVLFTSPHLPELEDFQVKKLVEKELGVKTYIINDANAAAVGEMHLGAARGARNIIYITLSTGIGGGIIIDGKIYTGSTGTAGDLGHMVIDDDGPICDCGNRGCWESLASGSALAREAISYIENGDVTSILDFAGGEISKITAETINLAAQANDSLAQELIARTAYYVGVGLANLVNIFNPEIIVIGGGLSQIGDPLLEPAFEEAKKRAFKQPYGSCRFARAELGQDTTVIGAAVYALDMISNEPDGRV